MNSMLFKEEKRIKTMSPKSMSEDDVKEYILFCKEQVSSEDLNHEIDALRKVLLFAGNSAVDISRMRSGERQAGSAAA